MRSIIYVFIILHIREYIDEIEYLLQKFQKY